MEFELTIIRDGVRTVIALTEEIQARSADSVAVSRMRLRDELRNLTAREVGACRLFMRAVKGHLDDVTASRRVDMAAKSAFAKWSIAHDFASVATASDRRREMLATVQAAVDAVERGWIVDIGESDYPGHVTFKITPSVAATPA